MTARIVCGTLLGMMLGVLPIAAQPTVTIEGVGFEAFPVQHSLRAPAVGFW